MMLRNIFARPFHSLTLVFLLSTNLFVFQNCTPANVKLPRTAFSSFSSLSCQKAGDSCETRFANGICKPEAESKLSCIESQCKPGFISQNISTTLSLCLPAANHFSIEVNGAPTTHLVLNAIYNLQVSNSSDQILNSARTSLAVVGGKCSDNMQGTVQNFKVMPWNLLNAGRLTPIAPGNNLFNFGGPTAAGMAGCVWRACVESLRSLTSCVILNTTPAAVVNPAPALKQAPVRILCSKPADTSTSLPCANLLGASYAGNYTSFVHYLCNGSQIVSTISNNSAVVCTPRQCPAPTPSATTQTLSCANLGPIFSGQYTETKSYQCDTNTSQWTATLSNTSNSCESSYTKLSTLQNINGVVEVPVGTTAYIDRSIDVTQLVINGSLLCGASQTYEVNAETIFVNGSFDCGSEAAPFKGKLSISLKRNPKIIPSTGRELNGNVFGPSDAEAEAQRRRLADNTVATLNFRALLVTGAIRLFGQPKSFARLSATANAGVQTIQLDRSTNWVVGDEIAIAPTSYESAESENFKIVNISGVTITVDQPLRFRHWGGAVEYFKSHNTTFPLDQRAEVVNLSRNIKIESHDKLSSGADADQLKPSEETSSPGGHVMVHQAGFAQISGVEFYKMGQAGIMGRYPFHWHNRGNAAGQFIKNSSVHKSFQRCITVHGTSNTIVDNNICYDFRGHGIFLEDGNETGNVITNNIGFNAKLPFLSKVLLSSDNRTHTTDMRFPAVSVFWISNPQNTVSKNIAAGSVGTGFWNAFEANYLKLATTAFNENTAHSSLVGQTWDGAPVGPIHGSAMHAKNPNNHSDRLLGMAHYAPTIIPVFDRMVTYKNRDAGMYFRGSTVIFDHALMADNGWSFFMAFNQKVRNAVIVGKSANVTPISRRHSGVILYDGPFELENIDFYNFHEQNADSVNTADLSPIPFYVIGGTVKLTNITNNLRFVPAVTYKILLEKYNGDPWVDKHIANSIRDLDGSFAGVPGGIILPVAQFTTAPGCTAHAALVGMQICPPATKIGKFFIASSNYGGGGVLYPFYARRSDGATSLTPAELGMVGNGSNPFNDKFTFIESPLYNHELHMGLDYTNRIRTQDLRIEYFSESGPGMSPPIKIIGYGSQCRLDSGVQTNSFTELMNANQNAYFSAGGSTFVRFSATQLHSGITGGNLSIAKEHVGFSTVSCASAYTSAADTIKFGDTTTTSSPPIKLPPGKPLGYIDRVNADGTVVGWACILGSSAQVDIHVYTGLLAQQGRTRVGGTTANAVSEPAVAHACADGTMNNHRFNFKPPSSVPASDLSGRLIYIQVINGQDNPVINGSGQYKFP